MQESGKYPLAMFVSSVSMQILKILGTNLSTNEENIYLQCFDKIMNKLEASGPQLLTMFHIDWKGLARSLAEYMIMTQVHYESFLRPPNKPYKFDMSIKTLTDKGVFGITRYGKLCMNALCNKKHDKNNEKNQNVKYKKYTRCYLVVYCSQKCRKIHWKHIHHIQCRILQLVCNRS